MVSGSGAVGTSNSTNVRLTRQKSTLFQWLVVPLWFPTGKDNVPTDSGHLGGIANARVDLFGADLHDFMIRAKRGLTRIGAFGEELPNIENRIELVSDKDEFGMPLAKIIHSYDKDAEAIWNANFEEGLKIAKAAGAKEVWSARANMPTIHLMGGTIMGTNAGDSITNSYGQTHEIPNLYVAGPGIFATAGASNPTYTIFALSLRGAEQLAENWATVAG